MNNVLVLQKNNKETFCKILMVTQSGKRIVCQMPPPVLKLPGGEYIHLEETKFFTDCNWQAYVWSNSLGRVTGLGFTLKQALAELLICLQHYGVEIGNFADYYDTLREQYYIFSAVRRNGIWQQEDYPDYVTELENQLHHMDGCEEIGGFA